MDDRSETMEIVVQHGSFLLIRAGPRFAVVGPKVRRLVWGFSCQGICFWFLPVLCSERKAVLRPVACDQVPGARGRCQGTEMLAQLSGLPLSVACVSQRLDA